MDAPPQTIERARLETASYAQELMLRESAEDRGDFKVTLIAGLSVIVAAVVTLPLFGVDIAGHEGQMVTGDYDSLTPEQLAQLSPAAGGQNAPSVFDRIFDAIK